MANNIDKVVKDIKSIKIQGATNIAKASIDALLDFSKIFVGKNSDVFIKEAEKIVKRLAWARPDEPLNQNLLALIIVKIKNDKNFDIKEKILNFQKYCIEALDLISKNENSVTVNGI